MAIYKLAGFGFGDDTEKRLLHVVGAYSMIISRSSEAPVRHSHPFWVLACRYMESELVRFKRNSGEWYKQPLNTVAITPPNVPYWQNFSELQTPMHAFFITFYGGESAGLEFATENGKSTAYFLDADGSLAAEIRKATAVAETGKADSFMSVHASLFTVISRIRMLTLRDKVSSLWTEPSNREEKRIENFKKSLTEFFISRLPERVSIEATAEEFGLSVPGLFKRCNVYGLESPAQIQNRVRIEKVKSHLLQGESLKAVAYKCGFYDSYHLSRVFKQYTGLSPRLFLKSLPYRL
ncbi:MAG: helix-turn-helix transcriptional regulator [Fibrobacteres bacterium]|nr:helix-turn-helix transcriptional regulator [Fibrobacterota bacterium]